MAKLDWSTTPSAFDQFGVWLEGESLGGTWTLAITDSVKGNTHTLNSWSLTVAPVATLLAAPFQQQSSFEPVAAVGVSRPLTGANGHDNRGSNAVDELFRLDRPAVDFADLLVDDELFPASSKRQGKRSAVDLVLEDVTDGLFDEQLVEDLAVTLV